VSILRSTDGGLARITLDRPPLNVITLGMLDALREALEAADDDPQVRVIRLDARGKAFSAGVDVADHTADKVEAMMRALTRLFATFEAVAAPTVAVVHGAALGGGCELALACDLCLASEEAAFGQPEIRLGLFAPPASVLLPRCAGERRALGLLLSGVTIPAVEAERLGLVNRVFPAAEFEAGAAAELERLLGHSGAALRLAKRAVQTARGRPPAEAHAALERLYLDELMRTHDATEGLRAFIEKRSPRWKHG
jgi:cyclohexa-1,5-dienecarbonyl-CoA hydratase